MRACAASTAEKSCARCLGHIALVQDNAQIGKFASLRGRAHHGNNIMSRRNELARHVASNEACSACYKIQCLRNFREREHLVRGMLE
jgi:hypothetical protein